MSRQKQLLTFFQFTLVLTLVGGFVGNVFQQVVKYFKRETVITSNVIKTSSIEMPNVIVCPGYKKSPYSFSELNGKLLTV